MESNPVRPARSRICEAPNAEGVFVEKGTEKYTFGTEVDRNRLIRSRFRERENQSMLGKTLAAAGKN